ncbi:MAG TPA: hypothetical protein VK669_01405 [Candidatus Limnocylindrales bacterium]|nr:hypothetical protein [Candidatus Limnocylindrales bacterium]
MLRAFVLAFAVLCIVAGLVVLVADLRLWPATMQLCGFGTVLVIGLLFERRYRGHVTETGHWEKTGERFIDPASGKLVEVRYDPRTGERDYRES